MKEVIGTHNKILEINLGTGKSKVIPIMQEDRELFLGGKGLGLKLLAERMPAGVDPLSSDNILVLMTGTYMNSGVPCSARFAAITKSPLTNIMLSSSCGGPFGMALKTAGYDGLILMGRAQKLSYIEIDEWPKIQDAAHLKGKDTSQTQQILNDNKNKASLVIGVAGENLVKYANAVSGHRFLGRGGVGAVMGSKNIKAIVVQGRKFKMKPVHETALKDVKKTATTYINRNEITSVFYRKYGTNSHVLKCNDAGILPVRNFTDGSHKDAAKISGELYAEKYTKRHHTCKPCTILCGHEGEFNGVRMAIPEYETTGLLGSNLEIFDPEAVAQWNDLCGKLGMDTITTGSVLGWAMEATQEKLIQTDLKFGKPDHVAETIESIAHRRGIGNDLAEGTRVLSQKYGGETFAMHVKGMEVAAYDPRGAWGQGLSYAVANRGGCHLSAPLFTLEGTMKYIYPYTTYAKAVFTDYFENMFAAINSMHGCQFTSFAYMLEPFVAKTTPKKAMGATMQTMPRVALALMDISVYSKSFEAITGIRLSQSKMLETGKRIHTLERWLNTREGISRKDDTLPPRFLTEGRKSDSQNRTVPLDKMLDKYYKIKGYDQNGIPTAKSLYKLKIVDLTK